MGTTVGLGTAGSYSVLGGETVTNTGPTELSGDLGVAPGTEIVGFPPGDVGGATHAGDAEAGQAKSDLTTAYNNAAGQASDESVGAELGGRTLTPGVYTASSATQITGTLTLDAQGDPGAVFIFQVGSDLTAASNSQVLLLNDAQSCHVFWQVSRSATIGTSADFVGTIMALTSITVDSGADVQGRALARNGAVTLDNNRFTNVTCATTSTSSPTPTDTATSSPTSSPTSTGSPTASPTQSDTSTASPTTSDSASPTSSASSPTAVVPVETSEAAAVGDLAFTGGGPSGPLIVVGLAASLLGVALVVAARRRRVS
ncbi:ice-binding family protein [Propionicimonas paludicola]|uniref:ice-binding family protein n=1 Tax=Propionicimonas paludicola TaxID=185243 RepID=UPI001B8017E2|nr:ice-binding family protein [Propionicimonas paludicola]